jgi:hypothetical protein
MQDGKAESSDAGASSEWQLKLDSFGRNAFDNLMDYDA